MPRRERNPAPSTLLSITARSIIGLNDWHLPESTYWIATTTPG